VRRSTLALAALLGAALLADVVLYEAFIDATRHAGKLAAQRANEQHRQLRPPPFLYEAKPPEFKRLVLPAPIAETFATEVPNG
jgi:hypothetical protein